MDTDQIILDYIKDDFKTAKEISEGTDIGYHRVHIRLKMLMKRDLVFDLQTETSSRGKKPRKYKVKINYF